MLVNNYCLFKRWRSKNGETRRIFFFTNNPDQYYNQSNKDNYLEYNFAILAFSLLIFNNYYICRSDLRWRWKKKKLKTWEWRWSFSWFDGFRNQLLFNEKNSNLGRFLHNYNSNTFFFFTPLCSVNQLSHSLPLYLYLSISSSWPVLSTESCDHFYFFFFKDGLSQHIDIKYIPPLSVCGCIYMYKHAIIYWNPYCFVYYLRNNALPLRFVFSEYSLNYCLHYF